MNYKRQFKFSVVINVLLSIAIICLVLNRIGILSFPQKQSAHYDYHNNSQYDAYLSMFNLTDTSADIIFAGDSLTARCHFDELLSTDKTILNRGIGSDTTEGLLNRIDEIIDRSPSTIFIMVGINDIANGISKNETISCYRSILSKIQQALPETSVYVQSILPCEKYNAEIAELNEALKLLADEHGYTYLDINQHFWDGSKLKTSCYASDGVHLNGTGYKIWIDIIQTVL